MTSTNKQINFIHAHTHTNIKGLLACFPHIPLAQLQRIIKTCSSCASLITTPALQMMSTNSLGLKSNALWQIDVTHIPQFGRQIYVFVTVDTYSHLIWTTVQTGENSKRLIQHMLSTFAMGIPQQIKTDNDPAFTSSQFKTFCTHWKIAHHTTPLAKG
jgi:transposase InsO family protein